MNAPSDLPSEFPWFSSPLGRLHRFVFGCFLLLAATLVALATLRIPLQGIARQLDGALFLLATLSALLSLTRRLPTPSVLLIAGIVGVLAATTLSLNGLTGIPFGAKRVTDAFGLPLFGSVQWPLPFFWITVLVASRGIARLILRPYRKVTYYGFWVIGLSILLSVAFQLSFEPYAVQVRRCWLWETRPNTLTWFGVPFTVFTGSTLLSTLALATATPWLLNKNPVKQPTDYQGLILWIFLQLVCGINLFYSGLPIPGTTAAVLIMAPTYLAIRGSHPRFTS